MLQTAIRSTTAGFDRIVTGLALASARRRAGRSFALQLTPADRLRWLRAVEHRYAAPEDFADTASYFEAHGALHASVSAVGPLPPPVVGEILEVRWPSRHRLIHGEIASRWSRSPQNDTAVARLFVHGDRPRPVAFLLHGYLGGAWNMEARVWPWRAFFRHGWDVAFPILPHHAVRKDPHRGAVPLFPGSDPRVTIEGFRQAIVDLRDLVSILRARGVSEFGISGMSLGGYTTSLAATLMDDFSWAAPVIPLASIADFARDTGRFSGSKEERHAQHHALDRAMRVVSPFSRPSRIPAERVFIIAGEGDRITPIDHAERLARHFGAELARYPGGHLLQVGRGPAFRKLVGRIPSAV